MYAKSHSYRELGDVAQGRPYICGMTVADPLKNRDQGKNSPLHRWDPPTRPTWMHTFGTAVHAGANSGCHALAAAGLRAVKTRLVESQSPGGRQIRVR